MIASIQLEAEESQASSPLTVVSGERTVVARCEENDSFSWVHHISLAHCLEPRQLLLLGVVVRGRGGRGGRLAGVCRHEELLRGAIPHAQLQETEVV